LAARASDRSPDRRARFQISRRSSSRASVAQWTTWNGSVARIASGARRRLPRDLRPLRRQTREFQGALDGLRAAAAEEDPVERGREDPGETVVQVGTAVVVEELGTERQRAGLGGERVRDGWVRMAEIAGSLPADTVDVLASGVIPDERAVAPHEREIALLIQPGGVRALAGDRVGHPGCSAA